MNIYKNIPVDLPDELFETIHHSDSIKIERIVSHGHCSPPDFWYDQTQNEWLVVLDGAARIQYPDGSTIELYKGDTLNIPAHTRHRLAWTDPDHPTIWLAVFYNYTCSD